MVILLRTLIHQTTKNWANVFKEASTHTKRHHSHTDQTDHIDFTKKFFKLIHLICTQQAGPSDSVTEERLQRKSVFFMNLWCKKLKIWEDEVHKNKNMKWRFYHISKEIEMSKHLEDTVWCYWSQWHHTLCRWPTHNFTCRSITPESELLFLFSTAVTLNPFPVRPWQRYCVSQAERKMIFLLLDSVQRHNFIYAGSLFCRCGLLLIVSLKFILKGSTLFSNVFNYYKVPSLSDSICFLSSFTPDTSIAGQLY